MAKTSDYGFGPFQYPRGWFMIAAVDEVADSPVPLRYFGEDLVLYRGKSGGLHLMSAYCPHMGAHLALNSTSYIVRDGEQIDGDSIRCPFHGWRFGPDGKCNQIPYSDFIPSAARIKTYPVVERAGIIWMWHDPEREGTEELVPDYPLPEFGGHYDQPGWVNWKIDLLGDIDIHGCEIVDNMADLGHMIPIHGAQKGIYFANRFEDHVVRQLFRVVNPAWGEDDGIEGELDTWYTGPGILQSILDTYLPSFMMVANTPIEDGRTRVWHALMVQMNDGSRSMTDEERATAFEVQEMLRLGLVQDIEIWANKKPCINPLAVPMDGPYGKLRLWYKQFFNPRDQAAEIHKRLNGEVVTLDDGSGGMRSTVIDTLRQSSAAA